MWFIYEAEHSRPDLELRLDDYKVSGGSIACSRDGTTFAFTIEPLSRVTMAALGDAAERQARICVYCCREPLLLDLVTLEREEPQRARIVGHIVAGAARAS